MPETEPVAAAPAEEVAPLKEDDPTAGNENIVSGPDQATALAASENPKVTEKLMAKVLKEGGKRGVEIEGAADMGGLQFFCTHMGEFTDGKVVLLVESMKAMNAISDPKEEERKGGAGKLGKMIFSFAKDEKSISAVAYVPKDKQGEISAKEWLEHVTLMCVGKADYAEKRIQTWEDQGVSSRNYAAIQIDVDSEANIFPIKIRDPCITHANDYLRKRGLFPEDDEEDDDDYVYGDDDFC